jgi:hypothetical protein
MDLVSVAGVSIEAAATAAGTEDVVENEGLALLFLLAGGAVAPASDCCEAVARSTAFLLRVVGAVVVVCCCSPERRDSALYAKRAVPKRLQVRLGSVLRGVTR